MTAVRLKDVTMFEAVEAVRQRGVWIQLEIEPLGPDDVDRSRAIADSRRKFSVALVLDSPADQIVRALVDADPVYDRIRLTGTPETFFIFPRSHSGTPMAASVLRWPVKPFSTKGASLATVLSDRLALRKHEIVVFDRAGFLDRTPAPVIDMRSQRPAYEVLGQLFARSGQRLTWTVGGIAPPPRTLAIGVLPPAPPDQEPGR